MWEGILATVAIGTVVIITVVAGIVLEELTVLPDMIRGAIGGSAGRKSLEARVEELEARLTAVERKLRRPAA